MSRIRTYRCRNASGVRLEDLVRVMKALGLEPQHSGAVISWKPENAMRGAYLDGGICRFETNKNGFLQNVRFTADTWGCHKRFERLCDRIWTLAGQTGKQVRVPVTKMDLAQFGGLAQRLGARLVQAQAAGVQVTASRMLRLQIADKPISIQVETQIEGKPTIVREIPPIVSVEVNAEGAIELVMPEQVFRQNQPALENLRRAAICTMELADKQQRAQEEKLDLSADLTIGDDGLIEDFEIQRRERGSSPVPQVAQEPVEVPAGVYSETSLPTGDGRRNVLAQWFRPEPKVKVTPRTGLGENVESPAIEWVAQSMQEKGAKAFQGG